MDYVIAGNVMIDTVRFPDGRQSDGDHIGGPATFAYSGVKLWTDSVMQCSNVGEDYHRLFDEWMERNQVIGDGIKVKVEHCNHSFIVFQEDGTYKADQGVKRFRSDWIQDFGYMKTSPQEIEVWTKGGGVKGVYSAQNVDRVFWRDMHEMKARDGFKLMWEIEGPSAYLSYMDEVMNALRDVDIFSINIQEARNLFGVETEEECIGKLQKLPVDMTLFRVGERGLYSVTPREAYYLPPAPSDEIVDPTGCGNTSTGAALYAYGEGYDPLMVGIMANVASARNISQFGVIPDMLGERERSWTQARELYDRYRKEYAGKLAKEGYGHGYWNQ